jgi:hypothetical protein
MIAGFIWVEAGLGDLRQLCEAIEIDSAKRA